jgi:hypothetical protein
MFIAALILVFRTDTRTLQEAKKLCNNLLKSRLAERATLDLDDCDRVLRVVTSSASPCDIEKMVRAMGINIEELS